MTHPRHQKTPTEALFKAKTVEDLELCVRQGADVNARNKKGATPIFDAVRKSKADMVRYLLSMGAKVDLRDGNEMPLCMAAARNYLPEIIDQLVEAGMDPFLTDGAGNNGVMVAPNPSVLKKLLQLGLDVNSTNNEKQTALHLMALEHMMIVPSTTRVLLEAGVDVNARDNAGRTPLMLTGHLDFMRALLKAGAQAELSDNEGRNALHHLACSMYQTKSECLELLILAGTDPLLRAKGGYTPMDLLSLDRAALIFGSFERIHESLCSAQAQLLERAAPQSARAHGPRCRF